MFYDRFCTTEGLTTGKITEGLVTGSRGSTHDAIGFQDRQRIAETHVALAILLALGYVFFSGFLRRIASAELLTGDRCRVAPLFPLEVTGYSDVVLGGRTVPIVRYIDWITTTPLWLAPKSERKRRCWGILRHSQSKEQHED